MYFSVSKKTTGLLRMENSAGSQKSTAFVEVAWRLRDPVSPCLTNLPLFIPILCLPYAHCNLRLFSIQNFSCNCTHGAVHTKALNWGYNKLGHYHSFSSHIFPGNVLISPCPSTLISFAPSQFLLATCCLLICR